MKNILILIVFALFLFVTACTKYTPLVYKIDIHQGNIITQKDINRIKVGMTKKQIVYVLGTPLIADAFHKSRWDYIYTVKKGYKKPTRKHVSIYFSGDLVSRIEGDLKPQPQASTDPKPETTIVTINPKVKKRGLFSRMFSRSDKPRKKKKKKKKKSKKDDAKAKKESKKEQTSLTSSF